MCLCWLLPPAFCFAFDAKLVGSVLLLLAAPCVSPWTNGPSSLCFAQRLHFYALNGSLEKRRENKRSSPDSLGVIFFQVAPDLE